MTSCADSWNDDDTSDTTLVERARRGDRAAFASLVNRYRRLALSLAWRMTSDAAAADDIAQEAFLRAFRRLDSFRGEASFKTWLLRIVVNLAANHRRSRKREVLSDPAGIECHLATATTTQISDQHEIAEHVREALAALAPHYRSVVVLREYENCSYQQIADILGIPAGTVMSRLAKARALLRERLMRFWKGQQT